VNVYLNEAVVSLSPVASAMIDPRAPRLGPVERHSRELRNDTFLPIQGMCSAAVSP
jgi:hypothetical protein